MKIRKIEGLVTAVTPLHVSSFSPLRTSENANHKFQLSTEMVYENQRHTIPMVPANTLRGLIRRQCADILFEKIGPVSLNVFQLLTTGSLGKISAGTSVDIELMSKGMGHLYMGLLGGGPEMVPGGVLVNNMVPVCKYTMGSYGLVPQSYHEFGLRIGSDQAETSAPVKRGYFLQAYQQLVSRFEMTRVDDLSRMGDGAIKDKIQNFDAVIVDYMEKVNASMSGRKEAKNHAEKQKAANKEKVKNNIVVTKEDLEETVVKAKKDTVSMMFSLDAISSGTPMYFRTDIKPYMSNAQIFFLAKAIGQVFTNRVGGWSRVGFGVCKPDLKYVDEDGREIQLLAMSSEGVWKPSDEICALMEEDYLAAIDQVNEASILPFTIVREKEAEPAKAGKGAKKKKGGDAESDEGDGEVADAAA